MILVRVDGEPIPQGSKKAFVRGRRAVIVDDNAEKLKPWRAKIAAAADVGVTFDCPVAVFAVFYLTRPKKSRWGLPAVKPDSDKLTRALLDGLQDGGLLAQDSRVVNSYVFKRYATDKNPPGVRVLITEAKDE